MSDELAINGIRTLWQNHVVEADTLPLNEIRDRARKFQRSTHLWNLLQYAAAVIVVAGYARLLLVHPSILVRAGSGLFIAAAFYGMYQMHKGRSARPVPAAAALTTCITFHRKELERQRDFLLRSWRYLLLPVPGAIVFAIGVASRPPYFGIVPAIASALLYAASVFAITQARQRQARGLQREIDALDAAENEW